MTFTAVAAGWEDAPPLNTPRVGASAVTLAGKIYVMGGKTTGNTVLNSVEVYDPASGTWSATAVPAFSIPRFNAAAAVYQGQIFLTGGWDGSSTTDEVEIYDPVQNSWSVAQKLRKEREGHRAVVFNGTLYVLGGIEQQYYYVNEIEYFDTQDLKWREADSTMAEERAAPFAGVVGNYLYVCGGEYYGAAANSFYTLPGFFWISGPQMQTGRHYGGSAVAGGKILMVGGETVNGVSAAVEIYDPAGPAILPGPGLPQPRSGLVAVALGDTLYAIGGWSVNHFQVLDKVEILPLAPVSIGNPPPRTADRFELLRGYPNPFNGSVQLQVNLSQAGSQDLAIYDITGRLVIRLHSGYLPAGEHRFRWNARDASGRSSSSGIYLAVLRAQNRTQKLKLIYAR